MYLTDSFFVTQILFDLTDYGVRPGRFAKVVEKLDPMKLNATADLV